MPVIQSMTVLKLKDDYPHFACAVRISTAHEYAEHTPSGPCSRNPTLKTLRGPRSQYLACDLYSCDHGYSTTPISNVVSVTTKVYL